MGGNQLCNFGKYRVGCGIVFKLTPSGNMDEAWSEKILYRFTDGNDGGGPNGGLVLNAKGSLFGTAGGGANQEVGVVYELTADGQWKDIVLYGFPSNWEDGEGPLAGVLRDTSGDLYGTASAGGTSRGGTVFRLKYSRANGGKYSFSLLHDFGGNPDGAYPASSLVFHGTSDLFGTTQEGGTGQNCGRGGCGTVFEVAP
jgi:hypothetical protein